MKLCNFEVGNNLPLFLIAGPCVIENEKIALESAAFLKEVTERLKINFIYKSSFLKANRTSVNSYIGPDFHEGLRILQKVKTEIGVPVLTDVHEYTDLDAVNEVVDVLQTPAFLCRQTAFMQKVASFGKPVNIKKGQFLAPWDMRNVVEKIRSTGNQQIMLCERGCCFGYNNLVVDMRSLEVMKENNCPVIYDAGHSVQLPGGNGTATGGQRQFIPALARAAVAVGIAGVFLETHPNPDQALCDGPNMLPLSEIEAFLRKLLAIDAVVKGY